jgi:hypothetical protein
MTDTPSPSRPRRWVYAPLALVLVLAAAWTAAWFYAADRAEGVVSAWLDREARLGRSYVCERRTLGGYPFRIEARCTGVTVTLAGDGDPVVLKARDVLAVAQVYQPDLVIAEATGPMTVATSKGEQLYVAGWTRLQASVRGRPRSPQRASLVVEGPRLDRPSTAGASGAEMVAQAERLELHIRRRPDGNAAAPDFDLVARLATALVPAVPVLGRDPIQGTAEGVLRSVKDLTARGSLATRLREWQAAGGKLDVTQARLQRGDALAVAQGEVRLNAQGRPDGALNLKVAGLDQVVGPLLGAGNPGRSQAAVLAGLKMLGRADLEGKRAVALPLVFRDGKIFLGPIPIGQVGSLF